MCCCCGDHGKRLRQFLEQEQEHSADRRISMTCLSMAFKDVAWEGEKAVGLVVAIM